MAAAAMVAAAAIVVAAAMAAAETEMVVSPRTLLPRSPCQIMEEAHHCESLVEP